MKWLVCACLALALAARTASALSPQDFAYGLPVVTGNASAPAADAAAYRVAIPLDLYRGVVRADLGDVRVFNARGESLPYAIRRPEAAPPVRAPPQPLPLFPLRGESPALENELRLHLDSPGFAVALQQRPTRATAPATVRYLLDARALAVPFVGLQLRWPDDAADFSGRIQVAASDDLNVWRTVVAAAPVANLHSQGQRLIENHVDLPATQAKFWRLSWVGQGPAYELTQVLAEPEDKSGEVVRSSVVIPGQADAERPGDFTFDLGAQIPVERADLILSAANSVMMIELSSRARPDDAWRSITRAQFYDVKSAEGEQRNTAVKITRNRDRYWMARELTLAAGAAPAPLALRVSWTPSDIEFLAQGPAPFLIAYGSASMSGAELDLSPLPKAILVERATAGAPQVLGGPSRLRAGLGTLPWQRIVLWSVLGLAVCVLGVIAYRLSAANKPPA